MIESMLANLREFDYGPSIISAVLGAAVMWAMRGGFAVFGPLARVAGRWGQTGVVKSLAAFRILAKAEYALFAYFFLSVETTRSALAKRFNPCHRTFWVTPEEESNDWLTEAKRVGLVRRDHHYRGQSAHRLAYNLTPAAFGIMRQLAHA